MRLPRLLFIALLALVAACAAPAPHQATKSSMVAAPNPAAVEAGVEILRRGGTAIDAAVAVQMALGVVEPQASGIGGGGFLLHYEASTRTITVYDGRETAPAGATSGLFLDRAGKPLPFREAVASGLSVGVPGAVRLLELAQREHGKLAWHALFDPAIALARDGFAMPPRLAAAIAPMADESGARVVYFNADGSPKKAGERIFNPALADTMALIATQGADVLYEGPIAREVVARVRGHKRPGTLSLADLANYRPIKREAVCGPYRVWTICGMGPPSAGGVATLQVLEMLQPFELSRDAPNSTHALHLIAEASRLAFADRDRYIADPAYVAVPLAGLLSPEYIAQRRKLISVDRSMGPATAGNPPGAQALVDGVGKIEQGTSNISVVDRWGNAVEFTTTVESTFGAQMMVRGFVLNNELTDFSFRPEIEGIPVANRVEPGKRPRSSMSPAFVLDRDRSLYVGVGSAGGARIIGDTLHALIGVLDWNLSMQAAIDLPRIANLNGPTELEDRPPLNAQAEKLRAMGHEVVVRRHDGGLTGFRRVDGSWEGGADRRRDGTAKGE
jgi:gamma-glutamyltranspeptidase / glutathione hydrolase